MIIPVLLSQVGLILAGYIKKSMPYGCFVEFPHNLSGLAPSKHITDEFLPDPVGLFQDMQTVVAKVRRKLLICRRAV